MGPPRPGAAESAEHGAHEGVSIQRIDRKSTRLNSSHGYISYAVFCLKKKNKRVASVYGSTSISRHVVNYVEPPESVEHRLEEHIERRHKRRPHSSRPGELHQQLDSRD